MIATEKTDDLADIADFEAEIGRQAPIKFIQTEMAASVGNDGVNCLDCGKEIPEARREFIPGCKFCVNCQGGNERRYKGGRLLSEIDTLEEKEDEEFTPDEMEFLKKMAQ